jgi:hypothetical protein
MIVIIELIAFLILIEYGYIANNIEQVIIYGVKLELPSFYLQKLSTVSIYFAQLFGAGLGAIVSKMYELNMHVKLVTQLNIMKQAFRNIMGCLFEIVTSFIYVYSGFYASVCLTLRGYLVSLNDFRIEHLQIKYKE